MSLPKFSALLSALGLAPKTLTDATAQLTAAKTSAEAVAALFTAAGMDLDALILAGPGALKAQIDAGKATVLEQAGVAHAEALAAVQAQLVAANTSLSTEKTAHATTTAQLSALSAPLAALGLAPEKPEALAAALSAHVEKQTTLALARSGHPPVAHLPSDGPGGTAPAGNTPPLTGRARVVAAFGKPSAANAARR